MEPGSEAGCDRYGPSRYGAGGRAAMEPGSEAGCDTLWSRSTRTTMLRHRARPGGRGRRARHDTGAGAVGAAMEPGPEARCDQTGGLAVEPAMAAAMEPSLEGT